MLTRKNLSFSIELARKYKNLCQKIRVMTEYWAENFIFCPNCGHHSINKYSNNKPVADFFCSKCGEDFELKSKKEGIGTKIVAGAYHVMIQRLQSSSNPNFFLLSYDTKKFEVINFLVIPKHFFIPQMIEKRKPLSQTAHRSGWIGCNILLQSVPETGKIYFVKNRIVESRENVLADWRKTIFLREENEVKNKGWLIDIMVCIENLASKEFSLEQIYSFESNLRKLHPENFHIKDKIRQQLQVLRDKGYLKFLGRGNYSLA